MAAKKDEKKEKEPKTIEILNLKRVRATVYIVGVSPMIMNRMSEKAKRELLLPGRKLTNAEKVTKLKHDPIAEYRDSVYRFVNPKETYLMFPGVAFKSALRNATTDMPGATKAAIGRLTYVEDESLPIYGTPQLLMSVVRQADKNRTPDIRTRAILPEWATKFTIAYQTPLIPDGVVAPLLAAAGEIIAVGDYRVEKGAGSYGRYRLVERAEWEETVKRIGALKEQQDALANPIYYDAETENLIEWYLTETKRRGLAPTVPSNGEAHV